MHAHTHTHTYRCTHTRTHVHTCTGLHAHTRVYTRTDVCTHAHMHTHAQACTHTHVYTHTDVRTHAHTRTGLHAHTCVYTRAGAHTHMCTHPCTHTHMCTHIYTHTHAYKQRHRLFVLQRARPVRVQIPAQTQIPAGRVPLQLAMGTQRQGMALTQTSQVCDCLKRLHSLQALQGLLPRGNAWSDPKAPHVARDEEAVQADGQTCPGHRAGQCGTGRSPGGSLFLPGLLPR